MYRGIKARVRERAYLVPKLFFHLNDEATGESTNFYFESGIKSLVTHLNTHKKALHDVVYMNGSETIEDLKIGVEVAFQYNDSFSENILSFANVIRTYDGGTHLTGFRTALTKVIKDYMTKKMGESKNKIELSGEDLKEGLTAVVFNKMSSSDIQFESQTKSKLNNMRLKARSTLSLRPNSRPISKNTRKPKKMLEKPSSPPALASPPGPPATRSCAKAY